MKIALVGYGRMGALVEAAAGRRGLVVAGRFTRSHPLRDDDETRELLRDVAVLVDFSSADAVPATVHAAARLGIHMAIGTTGWHDQLDAVRRTVEEGGIGVVHGSNFSLGANLFFRVVGEAARTLSAYRETYDPYLEESHHKGKKDSPSGTARSLLEILRRHFPDGELPVVSLRAGHIPGTHVVGFDSAADTILVEHRARSREGFAEGALLAARWIAGRKGLHGFDEVLELPSPGGGG